MRKTVWGMLTLLAFVTGLPTALHAQTGDISSGTYMLDKRHASLHFKVNHFGFSNVVIRFNDFDAELQLDPENIANSSLRATVELESVDVNLKEFEDHLRGEDFFDVANHPQATFVSNRITPTGDTTARVEGDMTLRGVTQPFTFEMELIGAGPHPFNGSQITGFAAEGTVNRSDFGMTYGLPGVAEEVHIFINAEFQLQE